MGFNFGIFLFVLYLTLPLSAAQNASSHQALCLQALTQRAFKIKPDHSSLVRVRELANAARSTNEHELRFRSSKGASSGEWKSQTDSPAHLLLIEERLAQIARENHWVRYLRGTETIESWIQRAENEVASLIHAKETPAPLKNAQVVRFVVAGLGIGGLFGGVIHWLLHGEGADGVTLGALVGVEAGFHLGQCFNRKISANEAGICLFDTQAILNPPADTALYYHRWFSVEDRKLDIFGVREKEDDPTLIIMASRQSI